MILRTVLSTVLMLSIGCSQLFAAEGNQSTNWNYSLGMGGMYAPMYLGAKQYRMSALPVIHANYKDDFSASTLEGMKYIVLGTPSSRVGAVVKYNPGRREDGKSAYYLNEQSFDELNGLGDVDGGLEIGSYVEFTNQQVMGKFEFRKSTASHGGMVGEAEVKYNSTFILLKTPSFFSIGPKVTLANRDYINAYFGINNKQATLSGLNTFEFNPSTQGLSAGSISLLSYGLHSAAGFNLNNNLTIAVFAGVDQIENDIAKSPLIDARGSDIQKNLGMYVQHRF